MVLLINSNRVDGSFLTIIPPSHCSPGNDSDTSDSPYRCRCWLKKLHALARPSGQSGLDALVETPPRKVTPLVLYIWISLICWLVWISLSFVSLFTMRVLVGHQRLLARWPGFLIFFDLLTLDKSSSVLLFLYDCQFWQRLCFYSSRRRRRASIWSCCLRKC